MNRAELVKRVSVVMRGQRYTEDTVGVFLDLVVREIREALERGETVHLRGFGTWRVVPGKARRGRLLTPGPLQGTPLEIPARPRLVFKAGQWSRELVLASPPPPDELNEDEQDPPMRGMV